MAETSYFWGGTTIGDCGPYSDDIFSDFFRALLQSNRATQAVIKGADNELAITNPGGSTIRVDTGKALVDGKLYTNSDVVDFSISAPGSGTNYYTLVLRKDFTAQTVRLAMLGPNAVTNPAVTQTDGTTWEVSIATVSITSAGVVSITDGRVYTTLPMEIQTSQLADNSVTNAKMADNAIDTMEIKDNAVTNDKLADNSVDLAQLVANSIDYTKLASALFPYINVGDIAAMSGVGTLSAITPGVAGTLLKSNGPGVLPSFSGSAMARGCMISRDTSQSIPNNTYTSVVFSGYAWHDTDGFVDGTSGIKIPAGLDGLYIVSACCRWATGNYGERNLQISGDVPMSFLNVNEVLDSGSGIVYQNVSMILSLWETNKLGIRVAHNVSGNLNCSEIYLSIAYLGELP